MFNIKKLPFERILMDGIQDLLFVIRVENKQDYYYEFLNKAAYNSTGLTEDVIGKTIKSVISGERANYLLAQYEKVVSTGKSLNYDDFFRAPTGTLHHNETTLTPLLNEKDEVTHIIAIVKDVTKTKWVESEIIQTNKELLESREKYRSLFQYNLDSIVTLDLEGKIVEANLAAQNIIGYSAEHLIGQYFLDFIPEPYKELVKKQLQNSVQGMIVEETVAISTSSEEIPVVGKFSPIFVHDQVTGIFAIFKDISKQVIAMEQLRESEERFRFIAEHSKELITLIDSNRKITYASPSYKEVLGYEPKELMGREFVFQIHPEHISDIEKLFSRAIQDGEACKYQFQQKNKSGEWIWCELIANPVFDENNQFIQMVVMTRDITLQKEYEYRLEQLANHDPLTELPNRLYFNEQLLSAIELLPQTGHRLGIMMLDIDDFKSINDTYGHLVGDQVLREFGNRVKVTVGDAGIVARLGGDEFIILLHHVASESEASKIAESILESINQPFCINNEEIPLTTSIGITLSSSLQPSGTVLVEEADTALYQAKQNDKNSYKLFKKVLG